MCTMTHHLQTNEAYEQVLKLQFDYLIRNLIKFCKKYFSFHLNLLKTHPNTPYYFLRFEDLISNKQKSLEDLFKFLLKTDDVEGTNI